MPDIIPGYTQLSDKEPGFKVEPVVVACWYCEMTIWAISANAWVEEATGRITCTDCRTHPDPERSGPYPDGGSVNATPA